MPKLWNETIEAHRREVRDATLDTTAALVAQHGLRSVTMSQIAEKTGIGRATLYKYFSDVEAILVAWHARHIAGHLEYLAEVRAQARDAGDRLEAVLEAYAFIVYEHHGTELAALLHRVAIAKAGAAPGDDAAELRLDIQPKRAAVFLDDAYVGHGGDFGGRFHSMLVAPGKHRLKVTLSGYRAYETEINPAARDKSRMKIVLEKEADSQNKP